jgi:hypothetical protein
MEVLGAHDRIEVFSAKILINEYHPIQGCTKHKHRK